MVSNWTNYSLAGNCCRLDYNNIRCGLLRGGGGGGGLKFISILRYYPKYEFILIPWVVCDISMHDSSRCEVYLTVAIAAPLLADVS